MAKRPDSSIPNVGDDPDLAAAEAKRADLCKRAAEVDAIIERLRAETVADQLAGVDPAALAGGDLVAAIAARDTTRALEAAETSRRWIDSIIRQAGVEVEALRKAARGRTTLRSAPTARAMLKRQADLVVELARVNLEVKAYDSQLRAAGLPKWPHEFGPAGCGLVGDPHDENSPAAHWLTALYLAGVIGEDDVPAAWRATWSTWTMMRDPARYDNELLARKVARVRRHAAELACPGHGRASRRAR